ncbi:MAG: aldo/keto reductase family oxidoreductase [Aestuariibacter sp.]
MSFPLSQYFDDVSRIALGCMGFGGDWNATQYDTSHVDQMHKALDAALDVGINVLDHADIYSKGRAEQVFGDVVKQRPELKEQLVIQSKCGIRLPEDEMPGRYDFSKAWVLQSVDGILQRLNIEQLDVLLLHRPDPLMELDELADAMFQLNTSGKVAHFGVSNMHVHQIQYLQSALHTPLVANQMQMSLANLDWLNESVSAGMREGNDLHFSPGVIEYCRSNKMQIQAWGCLAQGLFSGRDISDRPQHIKDTAELVARLAGEHQVSKEAIVLAWLMRHPANIQPVIGTTNPDRIRACQEAEKVQLSREHWYQLYVSARGEALP